MRNREAKGAWRSGLLMVGALLMGGACGGTESGADELGTATDELSRAQLLELMDRLSGPSEGDVLNAGSVTITSFSEEPVGDLTVVLASFVEQEVWGCGTTWVRGTTCLATSCPRVQSSGRQTHAGVITLSGETESITLRPDPVTSTYPLFFDLRRVFTANERVRISAEGNPDGAPAFTARIRVPYAIERVAPPPGDLTIDRDAGVEVVWSGEVTRHPGVAYASVVDRVISDESEAPSEQRRVECLFDSRDAAGVIPARALRELRPGDEGAFLLHSVASARTRRRADWRIELDPTFQLGAPGSVVIR